MGCRLLKSADPDKLKPSMEKLVCEKQSTLYCRFVLGVHKKSQHSAIRGELGKVLLAVDIIIALNTRSIWS